MAGIRTGENLGKLAAAVPYKAVTGQTPGFAQTLERTPGEGNLALLNRDVPLIGGLVSAPQRAVTDTAGEAQYATGGLLGKGFEPRVKAGLTGPGANPVNFVGNQVLGLTSVAAPAAEGLGALAGDTSEAASLADEAATHATNVENAAARGVASPAAAAGARAEATQLAADAHPGLLGRAAGGLGQAAKVGEQIGAAPYRPLQLAMRGGAALTDSPVLAGLAERVPGLAGSQGLLGVGHSLAAHVLNPETDQQGLIARGLSAVPLGHGRTLGQSLGEHNLVSEARSNVIVPGQRQATNETAPIGRLGTLQESALGHDPELHQALLLRTAMSPQGVAETLGKLIGTPNAAEDLARLNTTPRAVLAAMGQGTPADEAALVKAQGLQAAPMAARQADYLAGRGFAGGPGGPGAAAGRAEQLGTSPLSYGMNQATALSDQAAASANDALTAARASAGLGAAGPQPAPLTATDAQALADRLGIPVDAVHQAEAARTPALPADVTAAATNARNLQTVADTTRAAAEADPANWPARYRQVAPQAQRVVSVLTDRAAQADKTLAGSGDLYRQMAADIPTTLRQMVDAGIDPAHVIGGKGLDQTYGSPTRGEPTVRKLGAQNQKLAGAIPAGPQERSVYERQQTHRIVTNETAVRLDATYGQTAGAHFPGATGSDLTGQLRQANLTAWDPARWQNPLPPDQVTPATRVIPTALYESFVKGNKSGDLANLYDRGIRAGKGVNLALSPYFQAAVAVGDSVRAMVGGGLGPIEFGKGLLDAARALHAQPGTVENLYPQELAQGQSLEQRDYLAGRPQGTTSSNPLRHPVQAGWKLSGYVQSLERVGSYFAQQSKGLSPAAALGETMKVLGDFHNLTPFQQNVVRRIVPGVAFYKVIGTLAAHLALDTPERLAWIGYLARNTTPAGSTSPTWLSPIGSLTGIPALALPIRAAIAAAGGHTSSKGVSGLFEAPKLSSAGTAVPSGPLVGARLGELPYTLGQLALPYKLAFAATHPNVARYQTGEPILSKTAPAGTPYPGGTLGGILYAAGIGGGGKTAVQTAKAAKTKTAADKAAAAYQRELAAFRARGGS